MKKFVKTGIVSLAVCLLLCSCGNSNDPEKEALKSQIEALQAQISETSTSTEAMTEALSEETTTEETTEEDGDWEIKYYVDKFDKPTSEKYITTKNLISGKFSNSATDNSELKVGFIFDRDKISISLYEYGNLLVKNSNSYSKNDMDFCIYFEDKDGEEEVIIGTIKVGGDRIIIDNNCKSYFLNNSKLTWADGKSKLTTALMSDATPSISFCINDVDNPTSVYKFTLDKSNFRDVFLKF